MSRTRLAPVPQATWQAGALHVWGWDGTDPAGSHWFYGGFGRAGVPGSGGRLESPIAYGQLTRIDLGEATGTSSVTSATSATRPLRLVPSVRLEPFAAAVWLAEVPDLDAPSPSLGWFARLTRLALGLVTTGRISPAVAEVGPTIVARWRPVLTPEVTDHLAEMAAVAPPICRAGSSASTTDILGALVDGVVRAQLHHGGWRPQLDRQRHPTARARRAVVRALGSLDAELRPGSDDEAAALDELRHTFDRHARRLLGEPVVRPRVRLTVPVDPGDPWSVALELVDDLDPGRWCTAADVVDGTPAAVELAGAPRHLGVLRETLQRVGADVASRIEVLAPLAADPPPVSLEIELTDAEDLLEQAPYELQRLGIELLGPERLLRGRAGVRGRASPAPADDRRSRFAAEALVQWEATVDGAAMSDAELDRLLAEGRTLLHTGHRWVRLDPTALRRARTVLSEHREHHGVVGAAELLVLAARTSGEPSGPGTDGSDAEDDAETLEALDAGADAGWITDLLDGLPDQRLTEASEPPAFVGELRHYQRRGLSWMRFLADLGLGGCLADDMGLGKTATTLAHLVGRPGPHLVVCPLSVVHNWEAEARRFTPTLQVAVHHGGGRQLDLSDLDGSLTPPDLVITTYGLLAREAELASPEWSTVVLDEAQMIKNPATKAARAARRLRAGQVLALTGTPVENRLDELWALLDVVNPGLLGGRQRFRERYAMPIERHGDTEVAARLRRLTGPFVLRRTKADRTLLPDLPDKLEQVAYATLTREQAVLYQQVVDGLLAEADELEGMQRRGRVLAALTRLKQICNHPAQALRQRDRLAGRSGKLARFDELVTDLLDVDARALVFTQFREMGELLQLHIARQLDLEVPFLHGGVPRGQRTAMVDGFQSGAAPPLLLISLKAGGTGLNLTAASHVIHYDRWWNPAVEDQATDRAWRIGQTQAVNVHKLVCQGTVEERIGQVIDDKRALADAVVGSGEAWLSELSTDQLRELIVLDSDVVPVSERRGR